MAEELLVVAKAIDDPADDWHWVALHDAHSQDGGAKHGRWHVRGSIDTLCGILMHPGPCWVRLFDMEAPDAPTCMACLEANTGPGPAEEAKRLLEGWQPTETPAAAPSKPELVPA